MEMEKGIGGGGMGVDDGLLSGGTNGIGAIEGGEKNGSCKIKIRRRQLTPREKGTLATLCFINLLNYMDRFTLSGVLDQLQIFFELSNESAGLVQTVYTLAYMGAAVPCGYWGDRHSRRWGMGAGVGFWAAATLMGSLLGNSFPWFLVSRGLVGVGQAAFSTIAPTVISDMVSERQRSRVLAIFYFLLPIGSGLGYIVGSEAASMGEDWRWSLRATPFLGGIALLLIIFVVLDPPRGGCESKVGDNGGVNEALVSSSSYASDIFYLLKNRSFMLSTMGYTSVAFVSGALAWWGPIFLASGFALQPESDGLVHMRQVSFQFGVAMMLSGVIGVPIGSLSSQKLRKSSLRADPLICAVGLFLSAPTLWGAAILSTSHTGVTLLLIFLGMLFLNLSWCIVADILLYTVIPTRRAAAQGLQILISFALGAAISPYLVGLLSDLLLTGEGAAGEYEGLSRALYLVYTVELLGGVFFLLTAIYVVRDKDACDKAMASGKGTTTIK